MNSIQQVERGSVCLPVAVNYQSKHKVFVYKKHEVLKQPFPRLNLLGKVYRISLHRLAEATQCNFTLKPPVTSSQYLFIDQKTVEMCEV